MSKKVTDIVAYITIIGWLVAFLAGAKEESKFHINQALVLVVAQLVLGILGSLLPSILGIIVSILSLVVTVFWIIGLVYAITGQDKAVPVIGNIQIIK